MNRVLSLLILFAMLISAMPMQAQEPFVVIASFSILEDVVKNVGGDQVLVSTLVPINADPHSFQPSAQEVASLADADMVFISGAGFEQSLLEVIENAGEEVDIRVVSQCVEILAFGEGNHGEEDHEHDAESEIAAQCEGYHAELSALMPEESEEEHGPLGYLYEIECGTHDHEDEEGHAEGCDPHVWQDPHNVMLWTLYIRDVLSEYDPDNADVYAANAEAYLQQLAVLDAELHALVETLPAENRRIVTNHDTASYLAHAYGFEIVATVIPAASTFAEPGARDIARLIDLIRENDIQAIFAENTVNPDLAEQVASETGAQFYTLYTDSLSAADEPASTYIEYMRYNVTTIVTALQ